MRAPLRGKRDLNPVLPLLRLAEPGNGRAICWFKDTAGTPLEKAWEVVSLLCERGVPIEMIKSENPGKIIYEDEWRVAAKPRKKDRIRS